MGGDFPSKPSLSMRQYGIALIGQPMVGNTVSTTTMLPTWLSSRALSSTAVRLIQSSGSQGINLVWYSTCTEEWIKHHVEHVACTETGEELTDLNTSMANEDR
ncbi:hypothetical protein CRG98_040541 [Punica granatum]|uniref:Uncharacterized protein n=1 Tax=Punica granatum TaxID=22663 RepID=A0A2I0I4Y9_PUNGR|nr:hypothetical protein CRG98_040541 [Punica granatum]